jgi:hypothetical protein
MPRGIKGSGKPAKPKGDTPGPTGRRRGRKKDQIAPPADVQAGEQSSADLTLYRPNPEGWGAGTGPAVADGATLEAAPDRDPKLAAAEADLVRRYPARRIVPGSLRAAGMATGFGQKRTVTIECSDCGRERVLATSDLHHVGRCPACAKAAKKAKKRDGASN